MKAVERLEKAMIDAGVPPRRVKREMASLCDISPQAVHAWFSTETKRPSAEHLDKVAAAYGLNLHWIITGKGNKLSSSPDSEYEALILETLRDLPPEMQTIALRQLRALTEKD